MSLSTFFFAALGLFSAFIFFFLMRFKASSRQTQRDDKIKWNRYFSYNKEEDKPSDGDISSKKDAEFKN